MSKFAAKFREIVDAYLLHLNKGGEPAHLEWKPRRHLEGLVHASSLFDCPLKEALSRRNIPYTVPEAANEHRPTALMRMLQGNKIAEIFQEALEHAANKGVIWECENETFIEDYELGIQGQIDSYIMPSSELSTDVIEYKHRLPNYKDKFPQPRLGDVFQLFAYTASYAGLTQFGDRGHLVIINTPMWAEYNDPFKAYEVWDLVPEGQGYVLVSEHGHLWNDEYNTPDFINEETLKKEIARHLQYIQNPEYLVSPIDLADDSQAWQCRRVLYKPKGNAPGSMLPNCPFWCHSPVDTLTGNGLRYRIDGHGKVEFVYDF